MSDLQRQVGESYKDYAARMAGAARAAEIDRDAARSERDEARAALARRNTTIAGQQAVIEAATAFVRIPTADKGHLETAGLALASALAALSAPVEAPPQVDSITVDAMAWYCSVCGKLRDVTANHCTTPDCEGTDMHGRGVGRSVPAPVEAGARAIELDDVTSEKLAELIERDCASWRYDHPDGEHYVQVEAAVDVIANYLISLAWPVEAGATHAPPCDCGCLGHNQGPAEAGATEPVPSRCDVYVRARNVMRAGLRTQEIADGVNVDWWTDSAGTEHVAGVEVLAARGVEVDGLDVVKGRPHGTGPEWTPPPLAEAGAPAEPTGDTAPGEAAIEAGARALFGLTRAAELSSNADRFWARLCADGDRPYFQQAEAVLRAAALAGGPSQPTEEPT